MNIKTIAVLGGSAFAALCVLAQVTEGGKYSLVCPENEQAGIPIIECQPMDQQVAPGDKAVFHVKAKGENLFYQWYFQDAKGVSAILNATNSELIVPENNLNRVGFYWTTIISDGGRGLVQTQTRMASLGDTLPSIKLESGTFAASSSGLWTNPPPTGTLCCSPSCGYLTFNNNGLGYSLSQNQTFTISLSRNPSGVPLLDTSTWCARWRYGGQTNQTGCFTVFSSTQERFVAPATATYVITVYIKNNCPPAGTLYYLFTQ